MVRGRIDPIILPDLSSEQDTKMVRALQTYGLGVLESRPQANYTAAARNPRGADPVTGSLEILKKDLNNA
jgi:hypothetical protein